MVAADTIDSAKYARFGGWLIPVWIFGCLMTVWHLTSIVGGDSMLSMMFESGANVSIMRVILWLKVWTWMPLLILAPLHNRRMALLAGSAIFIGALLEMGATIFLLDLGERKVWAILIFNTLVVLLICPYLARSRRVAAAHRRPGSGDGRVRIHLLLLALVGASLSVAIFNAPAAETVDRVSILSAYQFAILLTAVLLVGPWRALASGRAAINIHLRRDIAIWLGIAGLLHLYAGTVESMTPVYIATYVALPAPTATMVLRDNLFVWGTIIGLVIGVLLLLLLGLSSDRALRRLGGRWWKRLQRTSYVVFLLTFVHALAFQYLEGRSLWLVIVMIGLAIIALAAQIAGFRAVRRSVST